MLISQLHSTISSHSPVFTEMWKERSEQQLKMLVGECDFVCGGQSVRIQDRSSHYRPNQHSVAVLFLEEQMRSLGYHVERHTWSEPASPVRVKCKSHFVNLVASSCPNRTANSEEIVVAAHYDTANSDMEVWRGGRDRTDPDFYLASPGADDNGSGTIAVLTLMERLRLTQFPGNITFLLCDGEEPGVSGARIGSAYFVDHLSAERRKRMRAAIVLDTIGHRPPHNSFNVSAAGMNTETLRELLRCTGRDGDPEAIVQGDIDRSYISASDNHSFAVKGVPTLLFSSILSVQFGLPAHYHTENDSTAVIDWDFYSRVIEKAETVIRWICFR